MTHDESWVTGILSWISGLSDEWSAIVANWVTATPWGPLIVHVYCKHSCWYVELEFKFTWCWKDRWYEEICPKTKRHAILVDCWCLGLCLGLGITAIILSIFSMVICDHLRQDPVLVSQHQLSEDLWVINFTDDTNHQYKQTIIYNRSYT